MDSYDGNTSSIEKRSSIDIIKDKTAPHVNFIKAHLIRFNKYIGKHFVVAILIVFVLFIFVNAFLMYNVSTIGAFNNSQGTKLDALTNGLYFTTSTMTTVGYGDITPQTNSCKLWVTFMQFTAMYLGMRLFDTISQMKVNPRYSI